jgi:hypothetical protein
MGDILVGRGPNGELRWVRWPPAREERHRRGSHREFVSGRSTRDDHTRRGLPSFQQIERMLRIYVASGEARGAFLTAKASERAKGPYYSYENEIRSHRSSAGSSDAPSDNDLGPGPPRPPQRPPGGPETGPRHRPEGSYDLGSSSINMPGLAHTRAEQRDRRMETGRDRGYHDLEARLAARERMLTDLPSQRIRFRQSRGGGGPDYDPEEINTEARTIE